MEDKKILWKNILKCSGKAILFGLLIALSLALLSMLFIPKTNNPEDGIYAAANNKAATAIESEPEDTIDLLILGDSEAYSAYIPMKMWGDYGWTSFNCGTGSQRLYDSINYLNMALKTQKLKAVVLDTNCIFRRCSPEQSWYNILSENIPAVKYHDRWKSLKKQDLFPEISYPYTSDSKGYYFMDTRIAAEDSEQKQLGVTSDELKTIPRMNRLYVNELLKICEKNDIRLFLVTSPSIKNWTAQKHNSCVSLAEDYDIPYLDLNDSGSVPEELQVNWKTDSRDGGDHLNDAGAQKATQVVENFIKEEMELPDHRDDEAYSDWERCFQKYQEELAVQ